MLRVFASSLLVIALSGCRPAKLAGESLGEFSVDGALESNTCELGYPAPSALAFFVEVRRERGSSYGYWKLPDGPLVSGAVQEDGTFRFEQRTVVEAFAADPDTGTPGCTLDRVEVVAGTAAAMTDAGAPFQGRTTITVSPSAGTYCAPLLTLYGGTFPVLPCRIEYALTGERVSAM